MIRSLISQTHTHTHKYLHVYASYNFLHVNAIEVLRLLFKLISTTLSTLRNTNDDPAISELVNKSSVLVLLFRSLTSFAHSLSDLPLILGESNYGWITRKEY